MMELVKIAKLGSRVVEVSLENATVSDALRASGINAEGFELRVNGVPATLDTQLVESDVVTLVPQIRGGR